MRCVVFSNNKKKLSELQDLLSKQSLDVFPYTDILGKTIDVVEDGDTFAKNAAKKVNALAGLVDDIVVADDSGLEVDCMNGKPGVYSARYGGQSLTDYERCDYLLRQIESEQNRSARFVCTIAIKLPKQDIQLLEGVVEGTLDFRLSGESGFGYDPIFIPNGYDQTFAQLGPEVKYKISHRSQALRQVQTLINDFLAKN